MVSTEAPREPSDVTASDVPAGEDAAGTPVMVAPEPTSVADIGLPEQMLIDLTLKTIRHLGNPSAYGLSERMAIPPQILNDILD